MNTESAQRVREFVSVTERKDGHVTKLRVPGHRGRVYVVRLGRNGGLNATCNLVRTESGESVHRACKGNRRAVCYHVLAAVEVAAGDRGCRTHGWAHERREAERLTNLHRDSEVVTLTSAQSGTRRYVVVSQKSIKIDDSHEDRPDLPYSVLTEKRAEARARYLQGDRWDKLESWADEVEELASWYDADLARSLAEHGVTTPQQEDKLRQLLEKYPEQDLLKGLLKERERDTAVVSRRTKRRDRLFKVA